MQETQQQKKVLLSMQEAHSAYRIWLYFYSLQNIWLLLLIGLDILTTILTKIVVPYI